jgi:Zn-dependent peptidase ImmA (M78 family)
MNNTNINRRSSLVASLRALVPDRTLNLAEARFVAEHQANRLLEALRFDSPPLEGSVIEELPRLDVQVMPALPGSGMSHWSDGMWHIRLNGSEPEVRRRFTLAHEFKHVLDAPYEDVIYRTLRSGEGREPMIEALCDHFAACLLMPKKWVKRYWGMGVQDPAQLALRFDVSSQAMAYRLNQLGLTDPTPRCDGVRLVVRNRRPPSRRYWRSSSPSFLIRNLETAVA